MTAPQPQNTANRRSLAPFVFGFLGSLLTHGTIAAVLLFRFAGGHAGGGENGRAGAGDTSVDVSLTAAPAAKAAPAAPTATVAPKPPTPKPPATAGPTPEPKDLRVPPPSAPSKPSLGQDETTNGGRLPSPVGGPVALGAGGDTIEGQRALLPHAAVCKDPVVGRWEALKYNPLQSDWVRFTLFVHRSGDVLHGTILSHTWSGGMFDRTPPGCSTGGFDLTVTMNATGRANGGAIRFGASNGYSVVAIPCAGLDSDYAPDHFTGTIDAARQEFQSLNNDGANDIDAPYVFRRTGCLDQ